jgi:hypothetical protein
MKCDHVFGPYFDRVPFKVYWLKCFKCGKRRGPWFRKASVIAEHHRLLAAPQVGEG